MTRPLPPGHPRHRYPAADTEPAPKRWQCAICIANHKTWEAAHRDAIDDATTAADAHPGIPFEAFLPDEVRDSWPGIHDAVTIATIPGAGTCAVCARHAP